MNEQLNLRKRIIFTGLVTILIWSHLAWDYFHDGVPTHHLFHSADFPGMSNWWGGIALPFITWFLLYRVQKRMNENENSNTDHNLTQVVYRFSGALIFGIVLSILFTLGSDAPGYMMIGIIVLSFFIPLFRAEYLLGYILGLAYTFGAIIPIVLGSILATLFFIAYKFVRAGMLFIMSKIKRNN